MSTGPGTSLGTSLGVIYLGQSVRSPRVNGEIKTRRQEATESVSIAKRPRDGEARPTQEHNSSSSTDAWASEEGGPSSCPWAQATHLED